MAALVANMKTDGFKDEFDGVFDMTGKLYGENQEIEDSWRVTIEFNIEVSFYYLVQICYQGSLPLITDSGNDMSFICLISVKFRKKS